MHCKWTILACTLVTSATFFVASHPALIRNIICQRYLFRRSKLVELWYSALLNELNNLNFNEQTPEWRLHGEAVQKLQSARERFLAAMNNGQTIRLGGPSWTQKANIRSAFESYKNECSEILSVIRNLNDIKKQKMKILPTVQEVYARHQIYVIQEPFISDVFRFKFREFIQCLDASKRQISSEKTVEDLRENYEGKFTDLKGKIQEDLRILIQRYGIGTPAYRQEICRLGDAYKREMDRLIVEFRSKCSDVIKKNGVSGKNNPPPKKVPSSVELDAELKKLLEDYWESDVIPLLCKFHHYLEETLCLTLQTSHNHGGNVFEVLHALQLAKRRFGDALWHARRDSKRHLAEIYQNTVEGQEYSEAIADILDEWRENMAPHLKRFKEELQDIDKEIGKMYEGKKIPRETPKGEEVKGGVGKIFDVIISSLIVDYDSCIEGLSELGDETNTPEANFKGEALLKLKKIRENLEGKVAELKEQLEVDMGKEKNPEKLGKLVEKCHEKLSPVKKEFKREIRKIESEIEKFTKKSTRSESPWRLSEEDNVSKILFSIPKILNTDENIVTEPYLDDLYRHCYRSSVMDFNSIGNQILELRGKEDEDILTNFKNCLSEFGAHLRTAKKTTAEALKNLDQNSEEYEKYFNQLGDKTQKDLNSLSESLRSKLGEIMESLRDKKFPKQVEKKALKIRDDFDSLFRDYWRTNVLPLLQKYHVLLEDLLVDGKTVQGKNIVEIIRSLKSAKRRLGDVIWDARFDALNNVNVACMNPSVQPQDAAHIFEAFKRNIEVELNRFQNELGRINDVFNKSHKRMNRNQPYFSSNFADSRFTEIFDSPLSTLILEYDSCLEELCKVPEKQDKEDILKRLRKSRDVFRDAINAVKKKGEEKLKGLKPNEIQDLIAQLKNDLSNQMNTFKGDLSKINYDLGEIIPRYQKGIKNNLSPWQLPSAEKLSHENLISENTGSGKQDTTPQSKHLRTPGKNFAKRGKSIQEPAIHDCFQGNYWQNIRDIDSIICIIEDLDCEKESPLYKTKKELLNRLYSLQDHFKREGTALREEADNNVSALGEKYGVGSSDYRKKLPKVIDKYKGRLTEVQKKLRSKLEDINELAKEKFPNLPHQNNNGSTGSDEELISILSDYWRKYLLPRMCDYLRYLEEIISLSLTNSENEFYKQLRDLQMAKRLFGDELMSQRHLAERNLKTARQKFGQNSPQYAGALTELKETWAKNLTPRMTKFEGDLSAVGGELEKICAKTNQKRIKPYEDKNLQIDDIRLCKIFDDSVLIFMIDCDAILENISDLSADKNSPQTQIKKDALQSLQQIKEKFWKKYNNYREELNEKYSQNSGDKNIPENIYDDYSSKLTELTTTSKSNLDNIRALLGKLKENGVDTREMSSKPWYPPLRPKSTDKKPGSSTNPSVNTDNTSKKEVLSKKGNESGNLEHNLQKSGEYAGRKISSMPILPEPILDDIFRYCYRGNVEYLDSYLSDLGNIQCQPNTPEFKVIQLALTKLSEVVIEFTKKLTELKKSAAADLHKILENCKPGSPEYWKEVSALPEKYKKQLEILENELKAQIDDVMKYIGKDIQGNTNSGIKPKTVDQLVSGNTELTEFLNAVFSSLVSAELYKLHCLQEEILRLMLEKKKTEVSRLYDLLVELLQEKRRFSDNLWQEIRGFVNGSGGRNNLLRNHDEYSHTNADSLKNLRQKISQLAAQLKDKTSEFDKTISEFSSRNNIERKQIGPMAKYNNEDNALFEDAILVFVLECDGRLEELGVIILDSTSEANNAKIEIMGKFEQDRENFMKEVQRLKSELYDQNNGSPKDDYRAKLNTLLDKFRTDMKGIDNLIDNQRKKVGIPKNLSSSPKSLIPWHPATGFDVDTTHKNPTKSTTAQGMGDKTAKEKVQPKNLPRPEKEVDIQEPFIHDTFQDDYRIVITGYDKIIKLIKKLGQTDLLKQLETAIMDYKQKYHDLRVKTAADLNKICESSEVDSHEYRTKISALLRGIRQKLKTLREDFETKRNEAQQTVSSKQPATQPGEVSDIDSKLENLLSEYWRTEILPRLLRFHRCLEGINNLIVKSNSADQKDIYKLLRSLQATKRKFGDVLWYARRDFTEEVESALKDIPTEKYSTTFEQIKTSWRKKLQPQLSKFSNELDRTDKSLDDIYGQHHLEKMKFHTDEILHFDDERLGKPFYDAIFIIIIEYDCRLDDLSKLILDITSDEGRSKSDAFGKLLNAWSDLFSSILKIKEELIAEVKAATDSDAIEKLLELLRSKLKGPLTAFRTLLGKVDSVLESLAGKLGLCFRQYSTTVSLSPWRIRIETDDKETGVADIVKSVANTLL